MNDRIARAAIAAEYFHKNQVRKWTGEPYAKHPARVAALVQANGGDDDMICAAFLHDVVEDCGVTIQAVEDRFGPEVASLVAELTKPNQPQSDRAKLIKAADIIDNCESIAKVAPSEVARPYLRAKWEQLATMFPDAPPPLAKIALGIVSGELERIGFD